MCTMTWFQKEQGYELFFNRDEQITRSQAKLPTVQIREGIQYISPTDTDAGGSWIAVNQFGVTVCLLNHYQFEQIATYKNWLSRGDIVRNLAISNTISRAAHQFKQLDLENYRAFRLFMIEKSGRNALFVWDGHQTRIENDVSAPKSSSSVNAKFVKASRKQTFDDLKLQDSTQLDDHLVFHSSHYPDKSAQSVCMHRADANTVSLSHIDVDRDLANFAYADGAPCVTKLDSALTINLLDPSTSVIPFAAVN